MPFATHDGNVAFEFKLDTAVVMATNKGPALLSATEPAALALLRTPAGCWVWSHYRRSPKERAAVFTAALSPGHVLLDDRTEAFVVAHGSMSALMQLRADLGRPVPMG